MTKYQTIPVNLYISYRSNMYASRIGYAGGGTTRALEHHIFTGRFGEYFTKLLFSRNSGLIAPDRSSESFENRYTKLKIFQMSAQNTFYLITNDFVSIFFYLQLKNKPRCKCIQME